ncbi:hypothetical protein [Kitasatospora sp. NPDC088779]|uniref:hypothetical protein n=1 Tax=Kitasatospora sp. NPDC088779 TaxID=3154964 RepID=UPI003412EC42
MSLIAPPQRGPGDLTTLAGNRDIIAVAETGRIGGITDIPGTAPALVRTRDAAGAFTAVVDTLNPPR